MIGAESLIQFIAGQDERLMRSLHRWPAPRWFQWWMLAATRAGDGWLWYALGATVLIVGGRRRYEAVEASGFAALAAIVSFQVMKRLIGRPRPEAGEARGWASLLPPDRFSFPSGHTMAAFAMAVSLAGFYPALGALLLLCAASIAASRLVLGLHFLSDVVVGALIGSGLGYLFFRLFV